MTNPDFLFSQPTTAPPPPTASPELPPIDDVMEWMNKRAWANAQKVMERILAGDPTLEKTQAQLAITIFTSKLRASGGKLAGAETDNNALQALIDGVHSGKFNAPNTP
jgi:hypothetical protein